MENIGIEKLTNELKRLNPNILIFFRSESGREAIVADCFDVTKLSIPNGYYFNEEHQLTNKHNTASGQYETFVLMNMFQYLASLA